MRIKESTSRILAGFEGALLCLPVTALFLYGGLRIIYYSLTNSYRPDDILFALAGTFIFIAIICAWRLLLSFIFGGRTKLQTASNTWWAVPYATGCLSLSAMLYVLITSTPSTLGMFGWGIPMILPLVHLHLERKAERLK